MGKPSILHKFIGKKVGGIIILKKLGYSSDGRRLVKCKCLECMKTFKATFHNVYKGNYKSCGCLQHAFNNKNPRWSGYGEISKSVFYALKHGAKSRNLEFEIDIKYIWNLFLKQNRKCALSGQKLRFPKERTDSTGTASLDRIDASKGYIQGNLQWVHKDINYMKQKKNNKEFKNLVKLIYKHLFKNEK